MIFDELNNSNFLIFAIKNYENPQSLTEDDFHDDLKRLKYIKRLINKYLNGNDLNINLVLNHIIVLYNVFGDAATPMLFHKISDTESRSVLKAFLDFIGRLPRDYCEDIQVDKHCINRLRKL
tara:strand:+ start:481 stop:846 length:366 start_codon:yes stop_codon:yes gene_type:complete